MDKTLEPSKTGQDWGKSMQERSIVVGSQVWILENRYIKGDFHQCFILKKTKLFEKLQKQYNVVYTLHVHV